MMDDLISRQAAIDAICGMHTGGKKAVARALPNTYGADLREIVEQIEDLPSAQPEVIRCNSCKYWTQSTGKMTGYGLGRCDFHDADLVTCNGYCYWAERRTK